MLRKPFFQLVLPFDDVVVPVHLLLQLLQPVGDERRGFAVGKVGAAQAAAKGQHCCDDFLFHCVSSLPGCGRGFVFGDGAAPPLQNAGRPTDRPFPENSCL
nr:MAG TPA: hypothetical protein [Caudoviricetes sp.]